jgi:7-carboxy-7-deazaguanine synthase
MDRTLIKYPVVEKFFAPQGEGLYTGTPMAFIRLVGCSVGHGVCHACDTDFDRLMPTMGGGLFTAVELVSWVMDNGYKHACLTGGEPLDRDLAELIQRLSVAGVLCHIETSGTKFPAWFAPLEHSAWLTVSPKPGYLADMVAQADEVKVVLGGLGSGPGWPTLEDALAWAHAGKLVFVQPSNHKYAVDADALQAALEVVNAHPELRLSVQMHKILKSR